MAQSRQLTTRAQRKGQTDVENIREEPVERYTVSLPRSAATVLELLAHEDMETPEDFIQRAVLRHLNESLDLLRDRGTDGEWAWKDGPISIIETAR